MLIKKSINRKSWLPRNATKNEFRPPFLVWTLGCCVLRRLGLRRSASPKAKEGDGVRLERQRRASLNIFQFGPKVGIFRGNTAFTCRKWNGTRVFRSALLCASLLHPVEGPLVGPTTAPSAKTTVKSKRPTKWQGPKRPSWAALRTQFRPSLSTENLGGLNKGEALGPEGTHRPSLAEAPLIDRPCTSWGAASALGKALVSES